MNDFLLHIYNYILEHLETDDPEYEENRTRASAQNLTSTCPKLQGIWSQEAVFLAAFRAGLYLGASAQCP